MAYLNGVADSQVSRIYQSKKKYSEEFYVIVLLLMLDYYYYWSVNRFDMFIDIVNNFVLEGLLWKDEYYEMQLNTLKQHT